MLFVLNSAGVPSVARFVRSGARGTTSADCAVRPGATAVSASQINLTWSDNAANETGFVIERCQGAGCSNFAAIVTVGANMTSYNNTGLDGVDQLLVSGGGDQRRRHLPLLEHGVGDDGQPRPGAGPSNGPAFTDAAGHVWSADQAFSGGETYQTSAAIAGTIDDALYQTERYCYTLFHTASGAERQLRRPLCTSRRFGGRPRISACSMSRLRGRWSSPTSISTAQVGAFTALGQTFPATVADGTLDIARVASTDQATIAAIEVRLAGLGPPPPTALVRDRGVGEPDST